KNKRGGKRRRYSYKGVMCGGGNVGKKGGGVKEKEGRGMGEKERKREEKKERKKKKKKEKKEKVKNIKYVTKLVKKYKKNREGATVIAADSNEEALEKASEKENVHGMRLDVSSNEAWDTFAKDVKEKFGSIDVLVNNAGVSSEKPYTEIGKDDWDFMMAISG